MSAFTRQNLLHRGIKWKELRQKESMKTAKETKRQQVQFLPSCSLFKKGHTGRKLAKALIKAHSRGELPRVHQTILRLLDLVTEMQEEGTSGPWTSV